MRDYKKILAAVDFSEHTDAVIKRSISLQALRQDASF